MELFGRIVRSLANFIAVSLVGVLAFTAVDEQRPVTAIDILLEPDATMLQHCEANKAQLLKVYPQGFALDMAHRPHITLIQRFVRPA